MSNRPQTPEERISYMKDKPYYPVVAYWQERTGGRFTARQLEIMFFVNLRLSRREIAEQIGLSEAAVRHHQTLLYRKLNLPNQPYRKSEALRRYINSELTAGGAELMFNTETMGNEAPQTILEDYND
jgi:DNA-binding NarL/FixJ family response regulator